MSIIEQKNDQIIDLIFQKKYVLLENEALKERWLQHLALNYIWEKSTKITCISLQEVHEYYGIQPRLQSTDPLFKLKSSVYAIIAIQRLRKGIL